MLLLSLLWGCSSGGAIVSGDDTAVVDDTGDDTGIPDDTGPSGTDLDQDGFTDDVDCDDIDPDRYPGAPEQWNNEDDDCDGRIDANGTFSGNHQVNATAVFEGSPFSFTLHCPTVLTRSLETFDFTVTCTPDPTDSMAMLLLGETVTVKQNGNQVSGGTWSGSVEIASSDGWDTNGQGTLTWVNLDRVRLDTDDSNFSLAWSGTGALNLEAAR